MLFNIFNACQPFLILVLWRLSYFICISASQEPMPLEGGPNHPSWNNFIRWRSEHLGRSFQSPCTELIAKFQLWLTNLREAEEHNIRFERGAEMYLKGLNKFSGQRPEHLVGYLRSAVPVAHYYEGRQRIKVQFQEVPPTVDWPLMKQKHFEYGIRINPTGWAVSAIKAVEAHYEKMTGQEIRLSAKEVLSCTDLPSNRQPITTDAFNYILRNGITPYTTYHYKQAKKTDCLRSEEDPAYFIKSYNLLEPEDQDNLKLAVALIGPISVSIKVTENFFFYESGVFYDTLCQDDGEEPNHAVLLMGYGIDPVLGEYWKVQNSWGFGWGEEGYARMARNTIINCGIASAAFYPEL